MCGINEWKKKISGKFMSDSLFFKIANEVLENKDFVKKVALYLGNEPLLDKKLEEKILFFRNGGINVNFSTNASLMNKSRAVSILESGVNHVNFSLDGLDKQYYESMRKGLSFIEVLGNVLEFINLRNLKHYKTQVRISIIKNINYIDDIPNIVDFWKRFLDFQNGDSIRIDELSIDLQQSGKIAHDIEYDKEQQRIYNAKNKPCYTLWNTMGIKADGSIALCCIDQCRVYKLGNLNETSIKENWQNNKIRESFKEIHIKSGRGGIEFCKNCIAWIN